MARVLMLADRLRAEGIDCKIDQYEIAPSQGWHHWMMNQLEWADFVVVVCTEQYERRFRRGQKEPGKGRGVTWEGSIIAQELYDGYLKSIKFVPVVFSAEDKNYIPIMFRAFNTYYLDTEEGYTALYRRLTNQLDNPKPALSELARLPVRSLLSHTSNSLAVSMRLEDVFKRSGIPTHTFVEPVEYRRLLVALRTRGRGLVVEGTSGVGKTTCVLKVLELLSLHNKKIKKLTTRKKQDREEIICLPKNNDYDLIIIDDFHLLEDTAKQLIADYMKVIADEEKGIKLILIGINKAGNSLVRFARDLNNRIETIRFGINPENKVIELVKKGEEALNIKFNYTLFTNIVKESYGSFHIAQLLCYEACILAEVTERTSAIQKITITFDAVKQKVIEELSRAFDDVARKFARGPKLSREGRAPYFHILHWLANDDKWSLELDFAITKYLEHRASVEPLLENGFIQNFIARNHDDFSDVIHYDSLTRILSIEDSKFVFFLRNLSWHQFAAKAGYLSVSFTGRYDFALSFAGADRNVAEAIARKLTEAEIAVFYDQDEQHRILANDLEEYLRPIYQSEAQFIIALLSKDYPTRIWAKFESEQFKTRFSKSEVIPIWFSDSPPGMFDETNRVGGLTYKIDTDMESQVDYIVKILIKKLGETRRKIPGIQ